MCVNAELWFSFRLSFFLQNLDLSQEDESADDNNKNHLCTGTCDSYTAFIINKVKIEVDDDRIKDDSVSFFQLKEVDDVYTRVVRDWHIDFFNHDDQIHCD